MSTDLLCHAPSAPVAAPRAGKVRFAHLRVPGGSMPGRSAWRRLLVHTDPATRDLATRLSAASGRELLCLAWDELGDVVSGEASSLDSVVVLGLQQSMSSAQLQRVSSAAAAADVRLGFILGADMAQLARLVEGELHRRSAEATLEDEGPDLVSSFSLAVVDRFASARCETFAFEEGESVEAARRTIVALAGYGKPIDMLIGPSLKLCGNLGNGLYRQDDVSPHTCQVCEHCPADPQAVKASTSVADLGAEVLYLAACSTASVGSRVFRRDLQLLNAAIEAGTAALIAITRSGAAWPNDPLLVRALLRSGATTGETVAILNAIHRSKDASEAGHALFGDPDLQLTGTPRPSSCWRTAVVEASEDGGLGGGFSLKVSTPAVVVALAGLHGAAGAGPISASQVECRCPDEGRSLTSELLIETFEWRGARQLLLLVPERLITTGRTIEVRISSAPPAGSETRSEQVDDPFASMPALNAFRLALQSRRQHAGAQALQKFMDACEHAALACAERNGGIVDWSDTGLLERVRGHQVAAVEACLEGLPTQMTHALTHWRRFHGQHHHGEPCPCCGGGLSDTLVTQGIHASLGRRITRDCRDCTFTTFTSPAGDASLTVEPRLMERVADGALRIYRHRVTIRNRHHRGLAVTLAPLIDQGIPWSQLSVRTGTESRALAAGSAFDWDLELAVPHGQPAGVLYFGIFHLSNMDFGAVRVPISHR